MLPITMTFPFVLYIAILLYYLCSPNIGSGGFGELLAITCLLGVPSAGLVLVAIGISWWRVSRRSRQSADYVALVWSCLCAIAIVGALVYAVINWK